jgi:hypothetical protein
LPDRALFASLTEPRRSRKSRDAGSRRMRVAALDAKRANGTITDDELSERSVLVRRKLRALGIEDHQ